VRATVQQRERTMLIRRFPQPVENLITRP